jgi:hypothetical protein
VKTALQLTVINLLLAVSTLSAVTHYVSLESTNPIPPYTNWATAATNVQDAADVASSGERVLVSDGVYAAGQRETRDTSGFPIGLSRVVVTNMLSLQSVNGPEFTTILGGPGRCVYLRDGAALTGFTISGGYSDWYPGQLYGGEGAGIWCASTNCFLTNCMIVSNVVVGAQGLFGSTASGGGVYGGTLYRCILSGNQAQTRWYVTNIWPFPPQRIMEYGYGGGACGSVLYNCTVSNSSAESGCGVYRSTLYQCSLKGNSGNGVDVNGEGGGAYGSTLYDCTLTCNTNIYGGGACGCYLYNCVLTTNYANLGGGADAGLLYNCTLTANSAGPIGGLTDGFGGGAYGGTLYNCIGYFNTAPYEPNIYGNHVNYCCTTPMPDPTQGIGNVTNAPLFVDYTHGDLRLQSNSPCINAGNNSYVFTAADADGNSRIVGGTVDIGAYECQSPALLAFYDWLGSFGLSTDAASYYADSDGDGMNNWQEWVCGTCPTNALSVLRMVSALPMGANVTVSWQSAARVTYFLERSTNLTGPFIHVASFIMGQDGTTSYADTNAAGAGPFFYRVGVTAP